MSTQESGVLVVAVSDRWVFSCGIRLGPLVVAKVLTGSHGRFTHKGCCGRTRSSFCGYEQTVSSRDLFGSLVGRPSRGGCCQYSFAVEARLEANRPTGNLAGLAFSWRLLISRLVLRQSETEKPRRVSSL